jgi:1,4-dihydroxy-6-naphthoate synthase
LKKVIVAHSPDADDIFMYYAIKLGWITLKDRKFTNIDLDIETLNIETLKGTYDISAISFALYPFIKDEYSLLKTAVSFGNNYGPKLLKRKGEKLKLNFKVALSGKYTTNALLFKIKYPNAKIIYMNFLDIEDAILTNEVDAGVLIHESILTYNKNLEVENEIYTIWQELINEDLPLPLGGMCLRRSLPLNDAIDYENSLIKAVQIATNNRLILSKMLIERNLIRVDNKTLEKYLQLYANDTSIQLNELQYKALDKLYDLGYQHGFYKYKISSKDFIIPSEYETLRSK